MGAQVDDRQNLGETDQKGGQYGPGEPVAACVDAVLARDYTVVQGAVLLVAAIFLVANLVVDLLYALIDPRIRYR